VTNPGLAEEATPGSGKARTDMTSQKATNPRRVGGLERDQAKLVARDTLRWSLFCRLRLASNHVRGESVKAELSQQERKPWRGKDPGEPRARYQAKPLIRVADSGAEQNPEGALERQEGNDAGNSERLRRRKKALKGFPMSGSGMKQGRQARGG